LHEAMINIDEVSRRNTKETANGQHTQQQETSTQYWCHGQIKIRLRCPTNY